MIRLTLYFSLILILPGCGGGDDGRQDVYPVSGKITMSGAPLIGATVSFAPQQSGTPTAIGRTDNEGIYHLTTYEAQDGAAAGDYAVVVKKISTAPVEAEADEDAGHSADGSEQMEAPGHDAESAEAGSGNLVPANYGSASSTPLSATVEEKEDNVFDFDIQ